MTLTNLQKKPCTIIYAAEETYTTYVVYYVKANTFIYTSVYGESGPDKDDAIEILYLNVSPDNSTAPEWVVKHKDLRQPWLGFGHLEEYLKNRPSPLE